MMPHPSASARPPNGRLTYQLKRPLLVGRIERVLQPTVFFRKARGPGAAAARCSRFRLVYETALCRRIRRKRWAIRQQPCR
jgi:hypothetical protein